MSLVRLTVLSLTATLCACASGGADATAAAGADAAPRAVDLTAQGARILADARSRKNEDGCGAAIASYRVVASLGKGHETAQQELGACLLQASAETAAEQRLLRDEGLFWLRRAAYAGEARAQLALATALSGAEGHAVPGLAADYVEAYGWSLIYADNAAHNLYGLPDLHPVAADHFRSAMTQPMIDAAEDFAAAFREIEMPVFHPPARGERARLREGGRDGRPQQRRR